jgi:hypothetical protein
MVRGELTVRVNRSHAARLESSHFRSLDRGFECLERIPDLLNLAPDQFAIFGCQVRSAVSIHTLQIANAPQKTR